MDTLQEKPVSSDTDPVGRSHQLKESDDFRADVATGEDDVFNHHLLQQLLKFPVGAVDGVTRSDIAFRGVGSRQGIPPGLSSERDCRGSAAVPR